MAEPPTTKPAPAAGDRISYRPISVLSLLGLGFSALFAVWFVGIEGSLAFTQGEPFFLSSWIYVIPATGIVISWLALRQIRNSEGTLAGETLAKWGIWVGILSSLGYGAYHLATSLAIQQQSNSFLMVKDQTGRNSGFFPLLLEGKIEHAFLLTQPPYRRAQYDPDKPKQMAKLDLPIGDTAKGLLSHFRESEVVRAVRLAAKEGTDIIPLGVQNWDHDKTGFLVEQSYRIKTSEIIMDIVIHVKSVDSKEPGIGRGWFVDWNNVATLRDSTEYTPKGIGINRLRLNSYRFLNELADKMGRGEKVSLFTEEKDRTIWPTVYLPKEEVRGQIHNEAERFFRGEASPPRRMFISSPNLIPWKKLDNGQLQFRHSFMFPVLYDEDKREWRFAVEGRIWVAYKKTVSDLSSLGTLPDQNDAWEVDTFEIKIIRELPESSRQTGILR